MKSGFSVEIFVPASHVQAGPSWLLAGNKGGGGGVVGQEREVPTPRAKYFSSQSLFLVAIMSVEWEIGVCYIPTLEKTVLYTSDSIV